MTAPEDSQLAELRRSITAALLELECAAAPLPRLAAARNVRRLAEVLELQAIAEARQERVSWAKIGAIYELTKQGAQQRFGDRLPAVGAAATATSSSDNPGVQS